MSCTSRAERKIGHEILGFSRKLIKALCLLIRVQSRYCIHDAVFSVHHIESLYTPDPSRPVMYSVGRIFMNILSRLQIKDTYWNNVFHSIFFKNNSHMKGLCLLMPYTSVIFMYVISVSSSTCTRWSAFFINSTHGDLKLPVD